MQDLIAYRVGSYHETGQRWLEYRSNIEIAAGRSDAIVAISDDTSDSIIDERLAVELQRIYVVKNGGDHLTDTDVEQVPPALVEKGLVAAQFLLVLGASYSHKNRDLAILAWKELRRRGHNIALVMAGAVVAKGSSRQEEAVARWGADEEQLVIMPDVVVRSGTGYCGMPASCCIQPQRKASASSRLRLLLWEPQRRM